MYLWKKHITIAIITLLLSFVVAFAENNSDFPYSGTLPVLFINTDDPQAIIEKDVYVGASYYLDALGIEGYESIGTAENPLRLQIKGRGNWTWETFDKKPYRIKLDKKQSLMGMSKSRHFVLLAHVEDYYGYLREATAFELSRRIGMAFTPAEEPIEVVLNGDYIGLYFLTEQIRVDKNRVNIVEQNDNDSVPENVTGGWLIEIDTHPDENLIVLESRDGYWFPFVSHSPEVLSEAQHDYIVNYINTVDSLIYESSIDNCEWANYLDIDSLSCFYIVNEVMDNIESFSGSCYLHKERGENTKLIFGPVWDFGNSFNRDTLNYIYEENPIYQIHWLKGVLSFTEFQQCVKQHWRDFFDNGLIGIDDFIDQYEEKIQAACTANKARWPDIGYDDLGRRRDRFKAKLHNKISFLNGKWTSSVDEIEEDIISVMYYNVYGHVSNHPHEGINIVITTYSSGRKSALKMLYR